MQTFYYLNRTSIPGSVKSNRLDIQNNWGLAVLVYRSVERGENMALFI